ncbi:MAG: hypothetical protein AAE985_06840 [Thermoplasmataceae archaeon]
MTKSFMQNIPSCITGQPFHTKVGGNTEIPETEAGKVQVCIHICECIMA